MTIKCPCVIVKNVPLIRVFIGSGGVSERFKEAVLKTVEPAKGSVGSNPTPSAKQEARKVDARSKT